MVLMPDGFPIAPRWIPPTRPACLTATECLKASDSAENASVLPSRWNDGMWHGIRWVRWGGRGDELRLRGVVIRSPGTDQTLATGGGRLSSVPRHRSRVVWHSPDEGTLHSSAACSRDQPIGLWHGAGVGPCHRPVICLMPMRDNGEKGARNFKFVLSRMKKRTCGFASQA